MAIKVSRYWSECISEALEEAGIVATVEQKNAVAEFVEGAHENYGMAHGHDAIPNPLKADNDRLAKELKREKDKVVCKECWGVGRITDQGPAHSSNSECWKCRGEGYVL